MYIKREDAINIFDREGEYHADTIADMLLDIPSADVVGRKAHEACIEIIKSEIQDLWECLERKPFMTEEVREAIMHLSMCARHQCKICRYLLTDECKYVATRCVNTIVDAFTERKRGEWIDNE